jgi:dCTP deaminase
MRLSAELMTYDYPILDMKFENKATKLIIPEDGLLIHPGKLYLGKTIEYTETTGGLVPMLEGRSSIGRLGLFIHTAAGFGDINFKGNWTVMISCVQPIRIYAGVQIAQIFYHTVEGEIGSGYSGKYQGGDGIQPSKLHLDFQL